MFLLKILEKETLRNLNFDYFLNYFSEIGLAETINWIISLDSENANNEIFFKATNNGYNCSIIEYYFRILYDL